MKGRILLVDDNQEFLDSTRDVLEDEGFEVVAATSGEDAIRVTRSESFDVILMDIVMPGMNGVESFIEMKKHNPGVRVVMVTAFSVEDLVRQALKEGACAVLHKPLDMEKLFETIDEAKAKGNGGLVLIAEDDRTFCDNLNQILGDHGYSVVFAYDGQEAVSKAEAQAFDVLLLDMNLPLLNGLEVYRSIKAIQPNVVAIVVTAYAAEMDALIQQTLDESAHICLIKPIDIPQLLGLLKEISAAKREGTYHKP